VTTGTASKKVVRSALAVRADDVTIFQSHRPMLVSLAYRMLGDLGRAEDLVQDAWLRWCGRETDVDVPRAFLIQVVTRLCLNELASARARREESRSGRLPEPIDLGASGLDALEAADEVAMAFLVALQRLTPAERATLLLHDVLDFDHEEIARILGKSEPASRQLLRRARENVAADRRRQPVSRDEHRQLLYAFLAAVQAGDVEALAKQLARDAVITADGGPTGVTIGGIRNLPRPLSGASRVAAFLVSVSRRYGELEATECELNGQPAVVALQQGRPAFAILLAVDGGLVRHVFVHADPARLGHLGVSIELPRR
jgi:RNA polymerase sigma-70 factor (ECF subfamily)